MELTNEDKKFLELYSDSEYEKPSVTVDAVILRIKSIESSNYRKLPEKKLQVYLTKREYSPYKGINSIVGTFINLEHELSQTMKLCVKNKVNLDNYYYCIISFRNHGLEGINLSYKPCCTHSGTCGIICHLKYSIYSF